MPLDLVVVLLNKFVSQGGTQTFAHYWRLRCRLPERNGAHCRVLARGSMGSIMIEFEDGACFIVGWRTIRRLHSLPRVLECPASQSTFFGGEQMPNQYTKAKAKTKSGGKTITKARAKTKTKSAPKAKAKAAGAR
jgi:hypothetical protein